MFQFNNALCKANRKGSNHDKRQSNLCALSLPDQQRGTEAMKTLTALAAIVLAASVAPQTTADTLKGGYPACVTEDLFNRISAAAAQHDYQVMEFLLQSGCFNTLKGQRVTLLDTKVWSGSARISIQGETRAFILWTDAGNIQK